MFTKDELVCAAVLWSGYKSAPFPKHNDEAVKEAFPIEKAESLLARLMALKKEFYKSDAYARGKDLSEVGDMASSDFKLLHPELSDEISEVLEWCYTYEWK